MTSGNPTETCEAILRKEIRYNTENHIWPSQIIVAERLLSRRVELVDAYAELCGQLCHHAQALHTFFDALLSTAALWSPEKLAAARQDRDRLNEVNRAIADAAGELAYLLEQRTELHNRSQFRSNTHYDVCEVIEEAGRDNHRFRSWVSEKLAALSGQFDLKYWPTLSEFMSTLARDAEDATALASDPLTEAGTKAIRPSRSDFFKAFQAAIEENKVPDDHGLPDNFRLSDATFASLANCILDLNPETLVDAAYVKRLRQREREAVRNT